MTSSHRARLRAQICLCASLLGSACTEVYGTPIIDVVAGRSGDGGAVNAAGGSAGGVTSGSGGAAEPATCPNLIFGFAGDLPGGSAGKTVRASSAEELKRYVTDTSPLVIEIATTITLTEDLRPVSDKTILGVGTNGVLFGGGFYIIDSHNIIVRNLTIAMVPKDVGDAIGIQNSDHIWIDHCDFSSNLSDPKGTYDGLVDITHGSDYVTLSWNHFHDHYDASLISHSKDAAVEDVGHLKVTLHHNWFHHLMGYAPRARFGQVHLFNNFYQDVNATAIISESLADVYVESNFFNGVLAPLVTHYQDPTDGRATFTEDNQRVSSGEPMIGTTSAWLPSSAYTYRPDLAESVPSLVSKCAGTGKL